MWVLISLITISWGESIWDAKSESKLVLIKWIILLRLRLSKVDVKSKLNGVLTFFQWKLGIQTDREFFLAKFIKIISEWIKNYKWMT